MVVDTSALIAIVYRESGHQALAAMIGRHSVRLISAASVLEASIVVTRRAGQAEARRAVAALDQISQSLGLTVEPVTPAQAALAREAYLRFGKGTNAAGLNYGDSFSYALAKDTGEPLLFKGEDFRKTDIECCS